MFLKVEKPSSTLYAAHEAEKERIIAAAIFFGGIVSLPPPARHHTIIQTMDRGMHLDGAAVLPQMQGFITSTGRYVNRVEAYYLAYSAGQLISETKGPELYSEDLW
jgi:hypothetical protein